MSQLFSLGLVFTFAYWRFPLIRPSAVVALPLMRILGVWVLLLEPSVTPYTPTYFNNWLWAHVGLGKIFHGFCLMGTALAGALLLRNIPRFVSWLRLLPADAVVDHNTKQNKLMAFIIHSAMLIAGAVW